MAGHPMTNLPGLMILSWVTVILGVGTAAMILMDEIRHPQQMGIMNIVWPVTGLYLPAAGLFFYCAIGRPRAAETRPRPKRPLWQSIFLSATHCGSGCVLGDVIGAPIVFGLGLTFWGEPLFADYAVEFVLAYLFGIAFQFFPIRAMRGLPASKAIKDAVKADTLSLVAFEIGMFGWMAIAYYVLPPPHPTPDAIVFWLMMQIGMMIGFLTTYPANWLLIRGGIKQGM